MKSQRILVVNPFGIGDVIFTLTLVEGVRKAFPDAFIGFLCNERTVEVVRLDRSVQAAYVFNRDEFRASLKEGLFSFFKKLGSLTSAIRKERYDTLLDLSLGREFSFIAMCLGIRHRIGFNFKGRGLFLTRKRKIVSYDGAPVAEIQLSLLEDLGVTKIIPDSRLPITLPESAKEEARTFLNKNGVDAAHPIIAVVPGGGKSWGKDALFKQWDPAYFAQVLNALAAERPLQILLLGDAGEKKLLEEVAGQVRGKVLCAAGEPLSKVCALLTLTEGVVGNDGGLMHLANALGVKTVSIFGPVDERVYAPYGKETPHEAVVEAVPCRPCYRHFYFPACPHHKRCLKDLKPEKVLLALKRIL